MTNKIEIIGSRFGRLIPTETSTKTNKNKQLYFVCTCDCGDTAVVNFYKLVSGHTKSCGCISREIAKHLSVPKHGKNNTKIYRVWLRMKSRCYNPKDKAYKWYGERGLNVSDSWKDFANFYNDMGDKPTSSHTLERINNSQGYSKENCKWATVQEQGANRRDNVNIQFNGKIQNVSAWAKELGLSHSSLSKRLKRWSVERALTEPKKK